MKAFLAGFLVLAAAPGLHAAGASPGAPPAQVYAWIKGQQQATGVVRNQEGDPFSGLYVDGVAALCYLHQGDVARAEKIFDFFDTYRQKSWGADKAHRGFPGAINADTGVVDEKSDRWIGDNSWLLLALNYHRALTGSKKYAALHGAMEDWLISLQDPDGGIESGFNKSGPMTFKSTEGNLDTYAALVDRPEARQKIYTWLTENMYVESAGRFRTGTTVQDTALDCCSWAVAALGPSFGRCLTYAETHYIQSAPMDARPGFMAKGFGDLPGKKRVWFEGTGEMIVAYRAAGRPADAEKWIAQMAAQSVQGQNGIGWPCSSTDGPWTGSTTRLFVPSNTWYLFGSWKFNPMNSSSWKHSAQK